MEENLSISEAEDVTHDAHEFPVIALAARHLLDQDIISSENRVHGLRR
jgi:hypothetical protein